MAAWGVLAAFDEPGALLRAVRRVRAAGYRSVDAYSPFPIDGLDEALALPRPWRVAALTLAGGLVGAAGGYGLQYYLMAVDYPLNVGGRPLHSWPAFIPVAFELMVLCAAVAVTVGLFVLLRLPEPHHPLFGVPGFERATQDRLFLAVRADDPRFDHAAVTRLLDQLSDEVRDVPA
jgi:hypothetical protein